jgi:excisionase family DNA binding protein
MSIDSPPSRLLSVKQAADYLNVSDSTVRRLVNAEHLAARKIGNQLRFDPRDLDRLNLKGTSSLRITSTGLPSDGVVVPGWAKPRLDTWREALLRLLPDPTRTKVIVIDRRGAK